ncbi:hypothetical protein BDZ97DRAFT_1762167 [Flammula alnicola]|nr:hypothetical protein BDZ97DRAFT_1762167 [Flammula alnicola]
MGILIGLLLIIGGAFLPGKNTIIWLQFFSIQISHLHALWGGRMGWIAKDEFGCHSKNDLDFWESIILMTSFHYSMLFLILRDLKIINGTLSSASKSIGKLKDLVLICVTTATISIHFRSEWFTENGVLIQWCSGHCRDNISFSTMRDKQNLLHIPLPATTNAGGPPAQDGSVKIEDAMDTTKDFGGIQPNFSYICAPNPVNLIQPPGYSGKYFVIIVSSVIASFLKVKINLKNQTEFIFASFDSWLFGISFVPNNTDE